MNLVAERRKIGVYYTTRTRNGKKHSYKNNIRMTFTEEPDGTEIYITPTEDGFKLSRTETEGSVMRQVHTIKAINSSKYADQTYLNFRGICEEEINFDIYKEVKIITSRKVLLLQAAAGDQNIQLEWKENKVSILEQAESEFLQKI